MIFQEFIIEGIKFYRWLNAGVMYDSYKYEPYSFTYVRLIIYCILLKSVVTFKKLETVEIDGKS